MHENDSERWQLRLPFETADAAHSSSVYAEGAVLLTERQVCVMLNISRTRLRTLPLRPVHLGRCVRYRLSDVMRYLNGLS